MSRRQSTLLICYRNLRNRDEDIELALSATAAFLFRPNSKIGSIHFDRRATLFQMSYRTPESAQRPRLPDRARTPYVRTEGGPDTFESRIKDSLAPLGAEGLKNRGQICGQICGGTFG